MAEYSTLTPQTTPVTRYLTSDHLGSPRIITGSNGAVLSRRDFMPYGEEAFIGVGNRAVGHGYTYGDSTRQKFTGYERDEETNLDFAQARMYSSQFGRFTVPDNLLNSGRPINPKSWNRYVYSLNNPMKFVDSTGLYEYAANTTDKDKRRFEKQFKKAKKLLAKIGKRYGEDSTEYKNASRGLNAYGDPNKANGVIVGFGETSEQKPGETGGVLDKDLKKSITVTIDLDRNKDDGVLLTTIAHEGSHVADRSELADAMVSAMASDPDFERGDYMGVINNDALNLTSNETETKAFGVSSVLAEFALKNEVAPKVPSGTISLSSRSYHSQSFSVGGTEIWNPAWKSADVNVVRANRSAAIAEGLKNDSYYTRVANTRFIGRK